VTPTGVRQLAAVQRPVEDDLTPVRHVTAQQSRGTVDNVLVDRRRVEVETVLLLGLRHRCTITTTRNLVKKGPVLDIALPTAARLVSRSALQC